MIQKAEDVVEEVRIMPWIILYLYVILQVQNIVSSIDSVNILTKNKLSVKSSVLLSNLEVTWYSDMLHLIHATRGILYPPFFL